MDHDLEVRSILSHAMLGSDENISKETFDLCVSETVKYIEKQLTESYIGNVMRSLQEKKKLWEERQSKYIDEEKSLTDDTDFDDERLILIENINLSEQIINDLEEIINQNFA